MSYLENAIKLRTAIDIAGSFLSDEQAIEVKPIYKNWIIGIEYAVDDRAQYEDVLYKCLQAHTSQEIWNPVDAPSLWAKVLIPDEDVIPAWEQPDSTNPYAIGDKVTHNGSTWVSIVDANVWEPGTYGWEIVEE